MRVVGSGEPAGEPDVLGPAALVGYAPACVWPSRPMRRIAVLTYSAPHPQLVSAVNQLVTEDRWVRWVRRGAPGDADEQETRQAYDQLAPWWDWADVVITDADHRSIAECVTRGRVPAVGLPSARYPVDARQSLELVQQWSARGLALQLALEHPSAGLLESAAGMRTRRCTELRLTRRTA